MLQRIIDYPEGTHRFASLVHFDWFEIDGDDFVEMVRGYRDYELVTDLFLERLSIRIETQRSRSVKYSSAMLERLGMAEKLLKELMDDATFDSGFKASPSRSQPELPEGLEGEDGTEEGVS